jgi:hypothetical protein
MGVFVCGVIRVHYRDMWNVMSMWLLLIFSDDRIVNYHCACVSNTMQLNKDNNKITELRTILQRESQNANLSRVFTQI